MTSLGRDPIIVPRTRQEEKEWKRVENALDPNYVNLIDNDMKARAVSKLFENANFTGQCHHYPLICTLENFMYHYTGSGHT